MTIAPSPGEGEILSVFPTGSCASKQALREAATFLSQDLRERGYKDVADLLQNLYVHAKGKEGEPSATYLLERELGAALGPPGLTRIFMQRGGSEGGDRRSTWQSSRASGGGWKAEVFAALEAMASPGDERGPSRPRPPGLPAGGSTGGRYSGGDGYGRAGK